MEISKAQIIILKLIAITSVIIAHVNIETTQTFYVYLKNTYQFLGSIGVGIFFFLQGYNLNSKKKYFDINKRNFKIILPWLTSSIFVYSYIAIRKSTISPDFLRFLFGDGSYLYFLTIFFIFSLLSFLLKSSYARLILMTLSTAYYIQDIKIMPFDISEHLNPLLWLPYLLIGYSIRNYQHKTNIILIMLPVIFSLFVFLDIFPPSTSHQSFNYLNINLITIIIFIVILMLNLSTYNIKFGSIAKTVSANTLFIYLWHMPLIGAINFVSNNFFPPLHLFGFLILLLMFGIIALLMSKNIYFKIVNKVIGIKDNFQG